MDTTGKTKNNGVRFMTRRRWVRETISRVYSPLSSHTSLLFESSQFLLFQIWTYTVSKNNRHGISWRYTELQTQCILLLGEQVLTIFLCIKRVRLNWNFIVNDVQDATYSSHGAPCPVRDLFPWLNTRVKVHISVWTIREYPKGHSLYLSDSRDTFLPLHWESGDSRYRVWYY